MNLKYVEFYQSVRLWNNQETKTLTEGDIGSIKGLSITLDDHLVHLSCKSHTGVIIVPTANMRHGGVKEINLAPIPELKTVTKGKIKK